MLREIIEGLKPYKDDSAIHNEYNSYKSILKDLKAGKKLYWANDNYELVMDTNGKPEIWVHSKANDHWIGLGDTEYDIIRVFKEK